MLYGQLPFDDDNRSLMYQKVIAGQFVFHDDVVIISDSAKDLIRRLLDPNYHTRLSMSAVKSHSWITFSDDHSGQEPAISSYLENYSNFLVARGLHLKPKTVG